MFESLKKLSEAVLEVGETRLDLAVLELEELVIRSLHLFFWTAALVFMGVMALTFLSMALLFVFWETNRIVVLAGMGAVYVLAGIGSYFYIRGLVARLSPPFPATIEALKKDRAWLKTVK